jgi:hypothetical protein
VSIVKSAALALILPWPAMTLADEKLAIAGHEIVVTSAGIWSATLVVDGVTLHENGLIFLDPQVQDLGGLAVVTGVAGAGGNACNAPPFVLALPEGAPPQFFGPVDSCAHLVPVVEAETLVFASAPLPGYPGEVWVWTPGKGFAAGEPVDFAASLGWEAFDTLAETHPADALAIAPVLEALQAGLGPDYPAFAERISDLGSGDLTPEGYLGQACIKFTCDANWALLYLQRETQGVFAAWVVEGDPVQHLWPADKTLWPVEALAALPAPVVDLPAP